MTSTRVLIVDDHQVFTDALTLRLGAEPDLDVVGVAATLGAARLAFGLTHPDLVLLDVDLDGEDGIELLHEIEESERDARVVVLTGRDDAFTAARAVAAGARGFVPKDTSPAELLEIVRAVRVGETRVPPALLTYVISSLRGGRRRWLRRRPGLPRR